MNMQPVSSSNLRRVGYDARTKKLIIEFHSGAYEYSNVPEHIYNGLMNSSSKGSYHADYIKNSYSYRRV